MSPGARRGSRDSSHKNGLEEAEQIVAALKKRNVPVEYLRYEDEGHGLAKLKNRLDAYPKMADFLDKYLR